MSESSTDYLSRPERLLPRSGSEIGVNCVDDAGAQWLGQLDSISSTGLSLTCGPDAPRLAAGACVSALLLTAHGIRLVSGPARLIRQSELPLGAGRSTLAFAFESEQSSLVDGLRFALRSQDYVSNELADGALHGLSSKFDASEHTIDRFYHKPGRDILGKCESFRPWVDDMQLKQLYQRLYRVTLTSALDHRVTVFDPIRRAERSMICFDSNSYLGIHRHPRVLERVEQVMRQVGYGTASAQLLCGTNRYLRELEEELSDFLGREDTIVFPSGFAANVGTIGALVRDNDAVLRDRFAHASIHEGCRGSQSRFRRVFAHNDMKALAQELKSADEAGCDGKLVVTDGVFSMHGRVAPLPELVATTRAHGARLMIDDAHGLGVLGHTGRGIEERWGMPGSVDVLMGTLSKALGAVGGFVSGTRDLVYYLRFYAAAGMFTTTLPAATCAGIREALRIVREEPQHREQLWRNIRSFVPALREAGFIVPDPESPIVTIFTGMHPLMLEFSRDLFEAGIKCGNVMFPAVPKGDSILRLTLNARHTQEDLEQTVEVLTKIGRRWGMLHRSQEEIREIGARVRIGADSGPQRPHQPRPLEQLASL